jgi:hypothetical protein
MTLDYRVEENYRLGVPQTNLPRGLNPAGIAWHWTAGATGRQGALGTLQFFIDAAYRNASYSLLFWWERPVFGVMWIVRPTIAAHSVNPGEWLRYSGDPARRVYEDGRFAEVRRILGVRANDPNASMIAASFCGMPADMDAALGEPDFVAGVRRLANDLSAIPTLSPRPHLNHGWGQPATRYDARDRLIEAIYGEAPASVSEDDMSFTWAPRLADGLPGANLYTAPSEASFTGTGLAGGPVAVLGDTDNGYVAVIAGDEQVLYAQRTGLVNNAGQDDPKIHQRIADAFNGVDVGGASAAELAALTKRLGEKDGALDRIINDRIPQQRAAAHAAVDAAFDTLMTSAKFTRGL